MKNHLSDRLHLAAAVPSSVRATPVLTGPTALNPEGRPSPSRQFIEVFPSIVALFVFLMGAFVLLGWFFNIPLLKTVSAGATSMKPNTALGFLISGLTLWLLKKSAHPRMRTVFASLVLIIASLSLIEYVFRLSFGIDELLFADTPTPRYPGRMAPVTALTFLLVAVALMLQGRKPRTHRIAQGILLTAALSPTVGMVGYLYGVPLLYGSTVYTAMALHTGAAFLILILGVLFVNPESGLVCIFLERTSGGILARVGVPASIVIPIILGYIFIQGKFNFGQQQLGSALFVVSNSVIFVGLTWTLALFLRTRELKWKVAERDANTDSLTGLMNRRYFEKRLDEEIKRSRRLGCAFSLILFDIDFFKRLNDSLGHLAGDQALQSVAHILSSGFREGDIVCRFGGEEFVVIQLQTDEGLALRRADQIRRNVEEASFFGADGVTVTISAGISSYPKHGVSRAQLLSAADHALYSAKNAGRNRVETFCGYEPLDALTVSAVNSEAARASAK